MVMLNGNFSSGITEIGTYDRYIYPCCHEKMVSKIRKWVTFNLWQWQFVDHGQGNNPLTYLPLTLNHPFLSSIVFPSSGLFTSTVSNFSLPYIHTHH